MKTKDTKKFFGYLLTLCMLLGIIPCGSIAVAATNDVVLAVLEEGQIYEFRNIGNSNAQLSFEGDENAVVDTCGYSVFTNGYTALNRGAYLAKAKPWSCNAGSMLVIEHRLGGSIRVLGDADTFQVRQLKSPALYVKTLAEGVTLEFLNSGSELVSGVNWSWAGYPKTTGGVGWDSLTYYTVHADGTSTEPRNAQVNSGVGVNHGDKLVIQVNEGDWPREVSGSYTAFSGQPYRLTIDGEKSYPPGSVGDVAGENEATEAKVVYREETYTFEHQLDWYLVNKSSTVYDTDLAYLAMAFSRAAYEESSIIKSLRNHEFFDYKTNYGNEKVGEYDNPPVAFGKKLLDNGDAVIAIIIKGTESDSASDWINDAGTGLWANTHARFEIGMYALYNQLAKFMEETSTPDKNTTFFITGHSKGGALANLLSWHLTNTGIPKDKLFTYTFATPNVAVNSDKSTWNPGGKYDNIFNICNEEDSVPFLPRVMLYGLLRGDLNAQWDKYGRTYWFNQGKISGSAHGSKTYLSWMARKAMPSAYHNSDGTWRGFLTTIFCPVDVEIVNNSGTVVAKIINNQPMYLTDIIGDVTIFIDGDQKYVLIRADSNYTVKLTATDNGAMDFAVQDIELATGETDVTKSFTGVSLTVGKQMTSDIGSAVKTQDVRLYVTNGSKVIGEEQGVVSYAADPPSSWAQAEVNRAISLNLVPQSLQSKYTQATTRAEFATLAVALYESVKGEITERSTFADTSDINVQKAAAIGVVAGVGGNRFDPDSSLTREQAATMLARLANAIGKPLPEQASTFADNGNISAWAIEQVGQVQAAGIMGGVGNNTFAPKSEYTREQSIVTILRLYDVIK